MEKERSSKERSSKLFGAIWVAISLLAIAFVIAIAGCTTQHKAVKYFDKHVILATEYCSSKYPCVDSVHQLVTYLQGEPIYTTDSFVTYIVDTVNNEKIITKYITKTITVHDTLVKEKVIYQTDKQLQPKLTASQSQAATYKASAIKWRKRAAYGFGLLFLLIAAISVRTYYKIRYSK